jgi:peptide/nickel transport system substrate-binding protein
MPVAVPVRRRTPARLRLLRSATAAVLAALTNACVTAREAAPADLDTGGTLIAVIAAEPSTLFPPQVTGTQGGAIMHAVFDKLAEIGPELSTLGDQDFRPRLASSWAWAPDSLSIAFTLDSAARWHDGRPVRAADVRYTFRAYADPAVGSTSRSLLGNIDSVSVRDEQTAVFWFKRRTPQQFFDATYTMYILPSHLLDSIPMASVGTSPFARMPVGTGRFRFARWEPAQRIEVVTDTLNFRGRAMLDRVIWSIAPDFGAATVKLFAGEADFIELVRPDDMAQVARTPSLRLVENRALTYGFLGFNLRAATGGAQAHPVFGDSLVRRALTMAVDRERLVRNVLDSLGMVSLAPAPRALIPDTAGIRPLPFDVAAARTLLDSAGWRDSNNDGVRDRGGRPLAFEILVPSSSAVRQRFAVLLQEQFRGVGAKVTITVLEGAAIGERVDSRRFDAYMGAWSVMPGLTGLRQTWMTGGEGNSQSYSSRAFDTLVDNALRSFDRDRQRTYFTQAFQQAVNDAPSVWLYEQMSPVVLHRRFIVPPLRPDAWYADLADWKVDPGQRLARDRMGPVTSPGTAR